MRLGDILRPASWSITTRMMVAATALLVVLLAVVVLTHTRASDQRRQAELDHAIDLAVAMAGIVDAFTRDLETTTTAVAGILGVEPAIDQETAGTHLEALAAEYEMLRGIYVVDLQGVIVASDSGDSLGADVSDQPYLEALRAATRSVWTDALPATVDGAPLLVAHAREIEGPDGATLGYVATVFHPPEFMERLQARAQDANLTLIDRQGVVLSGTALSEASTVPTLAERNEVQLALAGTTVLLDRAPGLLREEEQFGAIVPLSRTGWALAYTKPLAPLEDALRRELLRQVAIVTFAVAVIGAILTLITQRITRPLASLAEAASAVARGERPDIPAEPADAEVRHLVESMDEMTHAVAEREDALRRESDRRAILADASRTFSEAARDLDQALNAVAETVCNSVGDGCIIMLRDRPGVLATAALHHHLPAARDHIRSLIPPRVPDGLPGIVGLVLRSGQPLLAPALDLEGVRRLLSPELDPYTVQYGTHCLTGHPLRAHGVLLGALVAWRDLEPSDYTQEDAAMLQDIADRAALVIENARLFREVSEHAQAVDRALKAHQDAITLVAHDLKNPLATIQGTAQRIRRATERNRSLTPEELVEAMTAIDEASRTAVTEIDHTLDLATLAAGGPITLALTQVDLVPRVRALSEEFQHRTSEHTFVVEAQVQSLVGEWDVARLERALANLLENAVKYSPGGGRVHVRIAREHRHGDDLAVLEVRDEGVGIPRAALPRIFDRLYRAENVAGRFAGHGLGLTGVRYIVEAHGGSIEVRSKEGRGTTFTVRLPLHPAPAAANATTEVAP